MQTRVIYDFVPDPLNTLDGVKRGPYDDGRHVGKLFVVCRGIALVATRDRGESETIPQHYLASIDWGDGSPVDLTSAVATERGATCTFDVAGTHIYTTPGIFRVSVFIRDEADDSTPSAQLVLNSANSTGPTVGVSYPASSPARTGRSLDNVGYAYPTGHVNPLYTLSASVVGISAITHLALSDLPDALITGVCDSRYSFTFQCKATLLSNVCTIKGSAKYSILWEMYQRTTGGKLITRYIKLELWDGDPSVTDNFRATLSSAANSAVAGIANPSTVPYRQVMIGC